MSNARSRFDLFTCRVGSSTTGTIHWATPHGRARCNWSIAVDVVGLEEERPTCKSCLAANETTRRLETLLQLSDVDIWASERKD